MKHFAISKRGRRKLNTTAPPHPFSPTTYPHGLQTASGRGTVSATGVATPLRADLKVHNLAPGTAPARSGPAQGDLSCEIFAAPFAERASSLPDNLRPISARVSPQDVNAVTTPRAAWAEEADGCEHSILPLIDDNALCSGNEGPCGAEGGVICSVNDDIRRRSGCSPEMAWPVSMGATAGEGPGRFEGDRARTVYGRAAESNIFPVNTLAALRSFGRPSTQVCLTKHLGGGLITDAQHRCV